MKKQMSQRRGWRNALQNQECCVINFVSQTIQNLCEIISWGILFKALELAAINIWVMLGSYHPSLKTDHMRVSKLKLNAGKAIVDQQETGFSYCGLVCLE